MSLGGDAGAQLLVKLGLVEQAIEYAMEEGAFEHAFDLCHGSLKHKLPEVSIPSLLTVQLNRVFSTIACLSPGHEKDCICETHCYKHYDVFQMQHNVRTR